MRRASNTNPVEVCQWWTQVGSSGPRDREIWQWNSPLTRQNRNTGKGVLGWIVCWSPKTGSGIQIQWKCVSSGYSGPRSIRIVRPSLSNFAGIKNCADLLHSGWTLTMFFDITVAIWNVWATTSWFKFHGGHCRALGIPSDCSVFFFLKSNSWWRKVLKHGEWGLE